MSTHAEKLICHPSGSRKATCRHKPNVTAGAVIKYLISPQFTDSKDDADVLYNLKALGIIKSVLWYMVSVGLGFLIAAL